MRYRLLPSGARQRVVGGPNAPSLSPMRRWLVSMGLVLALVAITACDGGLALPEPAAGPPAEPPHPVSNTLVVSGAEAVDSQEISGQCVWLFLWAQSDDGPKWLPVAQNAVLITADHRNDDGAEVGCDLVGLPGPQTYELPMDQVPDGWYVVCNLSDQCSESFQKA